MGRVKLERYFQSIEKEDETLDNLILEAAVTTGAATVGIVSVVVQQKSRQLATVLSRCRMLERVSTTSRN